MRILVVEDEAKMLRMLRDGLREHGHTVMTACDGQDGLELAQTYKFDVVVLDVMLPKLDGYQVAGSLRESRNSAAILMLTACDGQDEIIKGLDLGADDYLTKPFAFMELLARIKSLTRRPATRGTASLSVEDLIVDCQSHQAFRGSKLLELTRTEYYLLECLIKSAGETVARRSLMESVPAQDGGMRNSTLDVFMSLLRSKVDEPYERRLIYTVRGVGYCLRARDDGAEG